MIDREDHILRENIEARISRIDERTAWMVTKLQEQCDWKASASVQLGILTNANLPMRMTRLENWRWYIAGIGAVLIVLATGRYIVGPTIWP